MNMDLSPEDALLIDVALSYMIEKRLFGKDHNDALALLERINAMKAEPPEWRKRIKARASRR
jgi:hypothetical protein